MLDPDIEGRLRALESEHLAALVDYLLGGEERGASHGWLIGEGRNSPPQTKTPGANRGVSD